MSFNHSDTNPGCHKLSFLDLKSADDVQEAYHLIRDVVPVTPQVIPKLKPLMEVNPDSYNHSAQMKL